MPQRSQITEDMVKPIVKNLLLDPTLLKDAISESGIEIVPKQSTPTHNKEITEESVTCFLVKNEIFMKNLIAKLTTALLASEDFHSAIEMQIEEKVNEKLKKACEKMKENTKNLEEKLEELSQYSRRNYLLIHGIKKEKNENTNEIVKDFFGKYLKININDYDVDRTHRLVSKPIGNTLSKEKERIPPIVVKFTRHDLKQLIYSSKKLLAKQPFLITECLTTTRMSCINLLKDLRSKGKILSYWTLDGAIFYTKEPSGIKLRIKSVFDPSIA